MSLMKLGIIVAAKPDPQIRTPLRCSEDLGMQVVTGEERVVEEGLDLRGDKENELEPRAPIITVMWSR